MATGMWRLAALDLILLRDPRITREGKDDGMRP